MTKTRVLMHLTCNCTCSDVLLWKFCLKLSFRISWQTKFYWNTFLIWVWMGWGKDWNLYHSELLWLSWVKILLRRRFTYRMEHFGAQAMPHMSTRTLCDKFFWERQYPLRFFPFFCQKGNVPHKSHIKHFSQPACGVTETQHGYLLNLLSHFHTVCQSNS